MHHVALHEYMYIHIHTCTYMYMYVLEQSALNDAVQVSQVDHESVQATAMKVVFDLLHVFGFEAFNISDGSAAKRREEEEEEDPGSEVSCAHASRDLGV